MDAELGRPTVHGHALDLLPGRVDHVDHWSEPNALDETVHLVVLDGTQVTFIDGIESSRALRAGLRVGRSTFPHTLRPAARCCSQRARRAGS
ncbi:IclR family transcriptional regulator domain-containing protein [Saccharopolyspora soli]|uniref:IclR family transcriptional regulator domain-containing protein n=1 Tax=Saccharopolyspora soli TaxID=2926618 RepID=UPI003FD7ED18